MNVGVVFGQMLVLLTMMLVGFFCYKKEWITDETSAHLSKLVVNVFNPILVINGVLGQESSEVGTSVVWNLIFIVAYFVILLVFGWVMPLLLRSDAHLKSIYRLMTIFSNVGFMGIPVIKSIYGNEAMIYVAFYILAYNIMLYTCGMHLARKAGNENKIESVSYLEEVAAYTSSDSPKQVRKKENQKMEKETLQQSGGRMGAFFKKMLNPGVVAAILAVVIFVTGFPIPQPVCTFCDYMGNATVPLSMLLIGISVAQADFKSLFLDWRIYGFILLRMILLPILMIVLLRRVVDFYGISPFVFGVFIIELGMPVGSIVALMVREQRADAAYCTKGVVLSTLASILTIPVICMFLR